ncbi:hypothetical protein BJX63DRAFT_427190 [Aspergillus granulosus]|uniref:Uncharacterized protein n=1 Tax=Aspergillus granulosus TaxID=176169 RepID=A0ABR4I4L7_9EURO
MYTSESLNGTIVPVSAFVLWPYAPFEYHNTQHHSSNSGPKFLLVAWAHSTFGVFPACAPSNYRSLQYNFMTILRPRPRRLCRGRHRLRRPRVTTLPNEEQSHAWFGSPAGANDVAYAIDASHKAFPQNLEADGPFVAMGHSQGGGVAWSFAERQGVHPQKGYRGTGARSRSRRRRG